MEAFHFPRSPDMTDFHVYSEWLNSEAIQKRQTNTKPLALVTFSMVCLMAMHSRAFVFWKMGVKQSNEKQEEFKFNFEDTKSN